MCVAQSYQNSRSLELSLVLTVFAWPNVLISPLYSHGLRRETDSPTQWSLWLWMCVGGLRARFGVWARGKLLKQLDTDFHWIFRRSLNSYSRIPQIVTFLIHICKFASMVALRRTSGLSTLMQALKNQIWHIRDQQYVHHTKQNRIQGDIFYNGYIFRV